MIDIIIAEYGTVSLLSMRAFVGREDFLALVASRTSRGTQYIIWNLSAATRPAPTAPQVFHAWNGHYFDSRLVAETEFSNRVARVYA